MTRKKLSRPTMSIPEAARFLELHERTVLNYVRAGKIVGVKLGKRWEIHLDRLDDFLKGKTKSKGVRTNGTRK